MDDPRLNSGWYSWQRFSPGVIVPGERKMWRVFSTLFTNSLSFPFSSLFLFSIYFLREAGQSWRSEDDLHQSGLSYHVELMRVSRLGHKGLYHISQIADLSVYKLLKGPHFHVSWPPPPCQLQDKHACAGSSLLEALAPASLHVAPPTPAL